MGWFGVEFSLEMRFYRNIAIDDAMGEFDPSVVDGIFSHSLGVAHIAVDPVGVVHESADVGGFATSNGKFVDVGRQLLMFDEMFEPSNPFFVFGLRHEKVNFVVDIEAIGHCLNARYDEIDFGLVGHVGIDRRLGTETAICARIGAEGVVGHSLGIGFHS